MKKKKIKLLFMLLIIIGIIFMGFSMAKSQINIKGNGKTIIARPILILEEGEALNINNNSLENNYYFTIKNYENNEINEVPLQYQIEIIFPEEIDIPIRLFKGEEEIILENRKSKFISLDNNKKVEHEYILKMEDIQNCSQDIIGKLQIKIHTEQIRR